MTKDAAQSLAISALSFLVAEPDRLGRFLAASGLDPADIRAAAQDPGFLTGVLDHLMEDEAMLQAFAAEAHLNPASVAQARNALGGPAWERDIP